MKDNILGLAANLQGTQYKIDNGFNLAARMTLNTRKYTGHEFGYAYSRTKLGATGFSGDQALSTHQGFYDFLLYGLPEGSRIRGRFLLQSLEEVEGGYQIVWLATVDVEGTQKPALVAEWVVRLYT